jgi:hypothetical protein
VGTELVDQAVSPLAVTERDEPLGQELDPDRGAVILRELFREERRHPVLPEQLAHRCARPGLRQEVIDLLSEHERLPLIYRRGRDSDERTLSA